MTTFKHSVEKLNTKVLPVIHIFVGTAKRSYLIHDVLFFFFYNKQADSFVFEIFFPPNGSPTTLKTLDQREHRQDDPDKSVLLFIVFFFFLNAAS